IVLQDQLGYRDILVYHRRGYTVFPSFALLQNHRLKNIFLPHLVNGYKDQEVDCPPRLYFLCGPSGVADSQLIRAVAHFPSLLSVALTM
ncbi:MAG: hypothetical protein NTZ17_19390, partial [Phycisphaerae bacterium]|nr:hypothetical protein [Phycisphaerae bacterium]